MYIYIRSMSEAQSKIYDKIVDKSEQINIHIAKIMIFPDSPYVDHWMHEIWAFLFRVDKLKGSNKYPKAKFIKKCLSTHNDTLSHYIMYAESDEEDLNPVDVSLEEYFKVVNSYQDWLSEELSANGAVNQRNVKNKLSELTGVYLKRG